MCLHYRSIVCLATLFAVLNPVGGAIQVSGHLPQDFKRDGSVSYRVAFQQAIDASEPGDTVTFPPGRYLLDNAQGLRIPAGRTIDLTGVTIELAVDLSEDGQAFLVEDAAQVSFRNGTILGHRETWPEQVNIAGIRATGASHHLRVSGMSFIDLSSNGVGVFGTEEAPIKNVWITDIFAENCCNIYYDYLAEKRGPAKGSVREDQGSICFYFVEDFVVRGNYLDRSRSDGTHFMGCKNGQISDNQILNSTMGGFFLERCHNVLASGNIMRNNGSRGCTIERNSTSCILSDNIVERSGREGLWAPDVSEILVSNNIFRENGQKDDADKDSEIRINDMEKFEVQPGNIRIEGNIFTTTDHCNGVIQVNENAGEGIVIQNNTFGGPVRHLLIDPSVTISVDGNTGLASAPASGAE